MRSMLLSLLALAAFGCAASGTAMVVGNPRPPIRAQYVRLYVKPPAQYEVVALLKAKSGFGWNAQEKQDRALEYLKERAAALGANGILITGTDETSTGGTYVSDGSGGGTYYAGQNVQKIQARAILVTKETR